MKQPRGAAKMKKLLLLLQHHPPPPSPSPSSTTTTTTTTSTSSSSLHRLLLLLLCLLSSFSVLTTLLSSTQTNTTLPSTPSSTTTTTPTSIPEHLLSTLLHYVPTPSSMPPADLQPLTSSLRLRCPPCNLLVFGLPHESVLLLSINLHPSSLTVFLHDHPHHLSLLDRTLNSLSLPTHFETYDVSYSTRVSDLPLLLSTSRRLRRTTCRPVQDLLYSDCDPLALNDLPNHLYDVDWDVLIVDGPSGYSPDSPGRAAAIFTAAVLARSGRDPKKVVDVFVHDHDREVERASSREFLCDENLVFDNGGLAHFAVRRPLSPEAAADFCTTTGRRMGNGTTEVEVGVQGAHGN